ncbi:hypothetical protein M2M59_12950 [Rummeliibacillus sp. G93]|nr:MULTISPECIES: hypothetical protein [Rummeliibacillus]MBB5170865.1 hypothetical protein [Rummeliibacillus stabekisii]MCM3317366.1 hypothetical protein [Rummeliibacillus stabekisii]UQW96840.1 hypothetical protein M2M59_12950 [Rummeliibacillus sp. G93]GEL05878.1 hypothetical protein RST01_25050 [Rummeliibacillus stabekisii]
MATFMVTVLGVFFAIMGTGAILVHFLRDGLNSSTSHIIDPKPETKF